VPLVKAVTNMQTTIIVLARKNVLWETTSNASIRLKHHVLKKSYCNVIYIVLIEERNMVIL